MAAGPQLHIHPEDTTNSSAAEEGSRCDEQLT
jgi:hypothetical protein